MAEHFHVNTPLLESVTMSKVVGTTVYLKMENSQPSGSFKIRGIGHLCQQVQTLNPLLVFSLHMYHVRHRLPDWSSFILRPVLTECESDCVVWMSGKHLKPATLTCLCSPLQLATQSKGVVCSSGNISTIKLHVNMHNKIQ